MRRIQLGTLSLAAFAFILSMSIGGCSSEKKDSGPTADGSGKDGDTKVSKKKEGGKKNGKGTKTAVASGKGTLKGRVTLDGKIDIEMLNAKHKAEMEKKADEKQHCLAPDAKPEETQDPKWVIGKDNGVANVFVMLRPAEGTVFEID